MLDKKSSKKIEFGKNFLIGSSIFFEKNEGKHGDLFSRSNWESMFHSNKKKFYNQIGPRSYDGLIENYDKYLEFLKDSNIKEINISLCWSMIFPSENKINDKVVEFYKNFFMDLKNLNIRPIISFINFDLPEWFVEKNAFFKKENLSYVIQYVDFIVKNYSEFFELAYTFDDPYRMMWKLEILEKQNPGVIATKQEYIDFMFNIFLFNAEVIKHVNSLNKKIKLGIKHKFIPFIFYGNKNINFNPESKLYKYNVFANFSLLDFCVRGCSEEFIDLVSKKLKLKINLTTNEMNTIKSNTINFLGLQYDGVCFLTNKENDFPIEIFEEFLYFSQNDEQNNYFYLDELFKIILIRYKNIPVIIHTIYKIERGNEDRDYDSKIIDDNKRIEHISKYLYHIHNKLDKLRILGFFYDSLYDSWNYFNTFRFSDGMIEIQNNSISKSIQPKNSFYWYKRLCNNRQFLDFSIKTSISKEVPLETKTKLLDL